MRSRLEDVVASSVSRRHSSVGYKLTLITVLASALALSLALGSVTVSENVAFRTSLRADVGTLTVFIGVLGGVGAFGPIGVFLGPLVLALVIALVRFALDERIARSGADVGP